MLMSDRVSGVASVSRLTCCQQGFQSLCARFRCLHTSDQELDVLTAEAEEEMSSALSEALDHSDILEYLSKAKLSSRQSQRTPERWSIQMRLIRPAHCLESRKRGVCF